MIKGQDDILYIDFGSGFLPVGCLKDNGIQETIDTLDSTTVDNGGWKTYTVTNQGYQISFSGVVENSIYSGGNNSIYSYDLLKVLKRNRVLIDWKIEDSEVGFIETGKAYITGLSSNSPINEFITFDGTLLGFGKPESSAAIPLDTGLESQLETLL